MIDPQIIQPLMFGSFILGLIIGIFPNSLGKLISFISAIPLIFFLLFISTLVTNKFVTQDIWTIIPWMLENLFLLLLAFACEGAGTGIVEGIKNKFFK